MKTIAVPLAAAAAALLMSAGSVSAQMPSAEDAGKHICLWTYDIDHTHVVNPQTILFYMKNGTVYRNDLKAPCPALEFHGFSYVTRSDQICGPEIGIRVIRTGEVCSLGEFSPSNEKFHW